MTNKFPISRNCNTKVKYIIPFCANLASMFLCHLFLLPALTRCVALLPLQILPEMMASGIRVMIYAGELQNGLKFS